MTEIKSFSDYTSKYNANVDYTPLFSGVAKETTTQNTFSLSDYSAIKNGSYGKLLKAYYAKQDADKASKTGDTPQKLTLMASNAESLQRSADALSNTSLWEKKKIKKKDEKTGKETETEDYDWEAITKAVKSFAEDYNSVIGEAGKSNTKAVLRNGAWLTGMVKENSSLLGKAGITIGKENKLEIDEEALKKADINVLKTLFTGFGSFADQVSRKASGIANAAASARGTYTRKGSYSDALAELAARKVDKEV